jgi:glycosyltransferase involved in cell wall biosynthesis
MRRLKILHVIDQLGVAGAERLLVNTVPLLTEYDHVIAHLHAPTELAVALAPWPVVSLDHRSRRDLPRSAWRLRALARSSRVDLIHSHLQMSTWVARLAAPVRIPIVTTVHSLLSVDAYAKNWGTFAAERVSHSRTDTLLAVSRAALDDYLGAIPFRGPRQVVQNFVPDAFFQGAERPPWALGRPLRCVTIGNLKAVKNHEFLLRAFARLRDLPVELDIFGEGGLREGLQATIDREALPVRLRGVAPDVSEILRAYDVFVFPSLHEGYGLTVAEAMASGLPVVASDLPVLREVTGGHAIFFGLSSPQPLVDALRGVAEGRVDLRELARRGRDFVRQAASSERYLSDLRAVYRATLARGR